MRKIAMHWHRCMKSGDDTFFTYPVFDLPSPSTDWRWEYEGSYVGWYYLRSNDDDDDDGILWASRCTAAKCPKHYIVIGIMESNIAYWVRECEVREAINKMATMVRLGVVKLDD